MTSNKTNYSADFFKKVVSSDTKKVPFVSRRGDRNDESSSEEEISSNNEIRCGYEDETSNGEESSSNDETNGDEPCSDDEINREDIYSEDEQSGKDEILSEEEIENDFNSEDKQISRLYRQVVDDIMDCSRLTESVVDAAIKDLKEKLHKAHKRGFRKFPRINFSNPESCCGYLRRYAICYTGLVKRLIWKFFKNQSNSNRTAKNDIFNNRYLKVVSLGGGPGNDLVGFCSALQEISDRDKKIKLTIVDNGKGWKNVFLVILKKAREANFGSFSKFVQKDIVPNFIKADLANKDEFRKEKLCTTLSEADLVLMVKFLSYLPRESEKDVIFYNVITQMKPNAKCIFIDQPWESALFSEIGNLKCIYRDHVTYHMCFKPKSYQSPSISLASSNIAVYEKMFPWEDS